MAPQALATAAAVSIALVWSVVSGDVLAPLIRNEVVRGVPYLRSALTVTTDIFLMIALVCVASRRSPREILGLAGLGALRRVHLVWALGVFAPVVAVCLAFAPVAADLSAKDFVWPGLIGPIAEELFYRGLAIGVLMRLCGWRFLPAALWPAVFFGVVHIWQGRDTLETVGVVAITSLGALLFGWLFVRWKFDLWPAAIAHIGMNCTWTIFALGETAVGGWLGNVQRTLAIVLAIGLTLWLSPKSPRET